MERLPSWLKAPLSKSGSPERRRGFKSHPLRHDLEMTIGVGHGASCVFLWTAGRPTDHFGDQILEARGRNLMVGFVDRGIRIQARIDHVNEMEVQNKIVKIIFLKITH
jgi:hypothetical protein